jgi:hypothetical protein
VVIAFLDYFFSTDFPENIEPKLDVNLDDYVGEWASTRRNHSTFEKLALLTAGLKITSSDNELVLASGSSVSRWIPVGNDKFRAKYSNRYLLFYRDGAVDSTVDDAGGAVTHFSWDSGVGSFERIRWYETRNLHLLAFGGIVLLALAYLGRFAYKLILLRNNENSLSPLDQWLAAVNSGIMLFLIYRLVVALTTNTDQFLYGVPTSAQFTFTMALVSVPFAVAINLLAIRQWIGNRGSLLARLNYGLLGLASLLFVSLLWFWNILNFYF